MSPWFMSLEYSWLKGFSARARKTAPEAGALPGNRSAKDDGQRRTAGLKSCRFDFANLCQCLATPNSYFANLRRNPPRATKAHPRRATVEPPSGTALVLETNPNSKFGELPPVEEVIVKDQFPGVGS